MSATKSRKLIAAIATPLAVLLAGLMVYQASYAAFTGQTRNSGNEWSTGSVNLTDDDNGQARFRVANMVPGDTETACITVTANASVPSTVKGYTINPVRSAQNLEEHILIDLESGTGGSFASCDGFTADGDMSITNTPLATLFGSNNWETAQGGWDVPAGTSSKTYRISWTFETDGLSQQQIDQLQGTKTGVDLQWEMRSN